MGSLASTRSRSRDRAAREPATGDDAPPHLRPAAARSGGSKQRIDPKAAIGSLLEDSRGASPLVSYRPLLARALAEARGRVCGVEKTDSRGLARYDGDIPAFATEVLHHRQWEFQKATQRALVQHKRVIVYGPRKTSKTHTGAEVAVAFMSTAPTMAIILGPTHRQASKGVWEKVRAFHLNSSIELPGECLAREWNVAPEWYAIVFATDSPGNVQSFHGGVELKQDAEVEEAIKRMTHGKRRPPARLLIILDEVAEIPGPILQRLEGSMMGDNVFVLGLMNPTFDPESEHPAAQWVRPGSGWFRIHVSGQELPNPEWEPHPADVCFHSVPDELQTPTWRERIIAQHGIESAYVRAHVFGLPAPQNLERQFVPFRILRGAFANEEKLAALDAPDAQSVDLRLRARHIGWDVAASDSGDWNVATLWVHGLLTELEEWRCADTMESLEQVLALADKWGLDGKAIPGRNIHIDGTGVGKGPADRLRQMGRQIDVVDFGTKPKGDWPKLCGEMKFFNRKAELLWVFRRMHQEGEACTPRRFPDVIKQAQWYTWEEVSRAEGTVLKVVEDKEAIRELYGRSPDQLESGLVAWSRSNPRPRFRTLHSMREISRVMA